MTLSVTIEFETKEEMLAFFSEGMAVHEIKEEPKQVVVEEVKEVEETITDDELLESFITVKKSGASNGDMKALLEKFNADNVTSIKPEDRAAALEELKGLGA